jgi:hypothetical protein
MSDAQPLQKWTFATVSANSRRVSVKARDLTSAENKARHTLDIRAAATGRESPVGWGLKLVSVEPVEPVVPKTKKVVESQPAPLTDDELYRMEVAVDILRQKSGPNSPAARDLANIIRRFKDFE